MLPLRLTVLALLPFAVPSSGIVYKKMEAKRAPTASLYTEAGSRLQCALRCLQESCAHWNFNLPRRRCWLYPLLSSGTTPGVTDTVYTAQADMTPGVPETTDTAQTQVPSRIPDGFRVFEGITKAFGKFNEKIFGIHWLHGEFCQKEGPRVSPAVPETEEEFLILRDFVGDNVCWVGLYRGDGGAYFDTFGRELQLNQTWLGGLGNAPEEDPLCFVIRSDGLNARNCYKEANFMCQYTP